MDPSHRSGSSLKAFPRPSNPSIGLKRSPTTVPSTSTPSPSSPIQNLSSSSPIPSPSTSRPNSPFFLPPSPPSQKTTSLHNSQVSTINECTCNTSPCVCPGLLLGGSSSGDIVRGSRDEREEKGGGGGHIFVGLSVKKPTWCCFCREFIWGILYQAHECGICHIVCHHRCLSQAQSLTCTPSPNPTSPPKSSKKAPLSPTKSTKKSSPSPPPSPSPSSEESLSPHLFQAVQQGDKKTLLSLLPPLSPPPHPPLLTNPLGQSLLHVACQAGHLAIAELLVKRLPSAALNFPDPLSWTPLHFASHIGHLELCHFLLSQGASPSLTTNDGSTPLHLLASLPTIGDAQPALYLQVLILLIKDSPSLPRAQNHQGETPFHLAAIFRSHKTLLYLLKFSENIAASARSLSFSAHTQTTMTYNPPPTTSSSFPSYPPPPILNPPASPPPSTSHLLPPHLLPTPRGETPLSYAVRTGCISIVTLLLDMGADPLSPPTPDGSPREIALKMGDLGMVELMDEYVEGEEEDEFVEGGLVEMLIREVRAVSGGVSGGSSPLAVNRRERLTARFSPIPSHSAPPQNPSTPPSLTWSFSKDHQNHHLPPTSPVGGNSSRFHHEAVGHHRVDPPSSPPPSSSSLISEGEEDGRYSRGSIRRSKSWTSFEVQIACGKEPEQEREEKKEREREVGEKIKKQMEERTKENKQADRRAKKEGEDRRTEEERNSTENSNPHDLSRSFSVPDINPELPMSSPSSLSQNSIPCSLEHQNTLVSGSLLISPSGLSFFRVSYPRPLLLIPFSNILSIAGCMSNLVVPDSFVVTTRTRTCFFRNIKERDDVVKVIVSGWRNNPHRRKFATFVGAGGGEGDSSLPALSSQEKGERGEGGGEGERVWGGRGLERAQNSRSPRGVVRLQQHHEGLRRGDSKEREAGGDGKGGGAVTAAAGGGKMWGEEGGQVTVRDHYGFALPSELISSYLDQQQKYSEYLNITKLHWSKYMIEEDSTLLEDKIPRKKLRKLIDEGVYPPIRPKVWSYLAKLRDLRMQSQEGYYEEAARKAGANFSIVQIEKDVRRTFPHHTYFQSQSGIQALYRILLAYSWYNPQLGYCQAMNYIAGFLLVVMKREEMVFWTLVAIINNYLNEYFSCSLLGSLVDIKVFEVLLSETQPKLYAHLRQVGYPLDIITTKWFMCLFAEANLPTETLLRIWDSFFLHGMDQLICTALAIFRTFEKEIMKCQDPEEVRNLLREQPSRILDVDKLMKGCRQIRSSIKVAYIQKMRGKIFREIAGDLQSFSVGV